MNIAYFILFVACVYYGKRLYGQWSVGVVLGLVSPVVLMVVAPMVGIVLSPLIYWVSKQFGIEVTIETELAVIYIGLAISVASVLRFYALREGNKSSPESGDSEARSELQTPKALVDSPPSAQVVPTEAPQSLDQQIDRLRAEHDALKKSQDS